MTTQYKVIANRDNEIVYTDGEFLGKCNILIFKREPITNDDIIVSNQQDDILEKIRSNKKTYVYTQHIETGNAFKIFQKIAPDRFTPTPKIPKNIPYTLTIDDKEDMRELINSGYEIYAFTSYKQYAKILADYFIENMDMYGFEKTPEEIYQEFVYAKPFERLEEPAKQITEKVLNDLVRAKEFWEKHESQIEAELKRRKVAHDSRIENFRKQQGKDKSISSKSS